MQAGSCWHIAGGDDLKIITGMYYGVAEALHLELPGKKISLEIRRCTPESLGMVTKWDVDPNGQHWLHTTGAITLFQDGLDFDETGVLISADDEWLNSLDEEYRWKAIIE